MLAALITTCAVFAPMYDRATQQALVDVRLGQVPEQVRGLGLVSAPALGNNFSGATSAASTMELNSLDSLVPTNVRRQFRAPVESYGATATVSPDTASSGSGPLLWRAGACDHVTVVDGRCPHAVGEIMVTGADARVFHYRVGSRLRVTGAVDDAVAGRPAATGGLRVVGIYRQVRGPYWFGRILAGRSGIVDTTPPVHVQHDTWLTARSTFETGTVPPLPSPSTGIDYPLDVAATGIDQLLELGPRITDLDLAAKKVATQGQDATVYSGLAQLAHSLGVEREQSRVTIPLLMLQLGLLAVVVLWLVLAAATEQRRPEVALALLRGRGRAGARTLLLRELLPVTLAGVPLGVVAAAVLCWAARTLFLPGAAPFEVRPAPVLTTLAAAVVLATLTLLAVRRVTREPVETLLRRVPSRRAGWGLGVTETLVLAAAGTAVVAFVTGGLTGPIALAAPALLALVVGMLLAHATVPRRGRRRAPSAAPRARTAGRERARRRAYAGHPSYRRHRHGRHGPPGVLRRCAGGGRPQPGLCRRAGVRRSTGRHRPRLRPPHDPWRPRRRRPTWPYGHPRGQAEPARHRGTGDARGRARPVPPHRPVPGPGPGPDPLAGPRPALPGADPAPGHAPHRPDLDRIARGDRTGGRRATDGHAGPRGRTERDARRAAGHRRHRQPHAPLQRRAPLPARLPAVRHHRHHHTGQLDLRNDRARRAARRRPGRPDRPRRAVGLGRRRDHGQS